MGRFTPSVAPDPVSLEAAWRSGPSPHDIIGNFLLGERLVARGRRAVAAQHFQRAAGAEPVEIDHWLYKALSLMRLGRADEAEAPLRHFLTLQPNHVDGTYHLAQLLIDRDDLPEAVALLAPVIESEQDRIAALAPAVFQLRLRGMKEAEPFLQRIAERARDDIVANFLLGERLVARGRGAVAAQHFQKAVGAEPIEVDHWLYKALSLMRLGRADEAEAPLRHFLTLQPNHVDGTYHLAQLLIDRDDLREAVALLAPVIESEQDRIAALAPVVFQLRLRGVKEAEPFLHRLAKSAVGDAKALYDLAHSAYFGQAPEWVVTFTARARAIADSPALRICHDLLLPDIPSSADDIQRWVERFRTNVTALAASGLRISDPLQQFVQPPHFELFYYGIDTRDLYAAAANTWLTLHPELKWTAPHYQTWKTRPLKQRLRVGFLTAPTFPLMWGIARELDRSGFEVVNLFEDSDLSEGAQWWATRPTDWSGAVDWQVAIPDNSLPEARRAVAEQQLDILVHTPFSGLRYFLSHARLAPVQCVLCEPAWTDGVPNLDYYISWAPAEPARPEEHYITSVALMTRPPYWVERDYSKPAALQREDFDLPQEARWYVCPAAPLKMHPRFDHVLAQLLAADPEGILVLLRSDWNPARAVERRLRGALGPVADRLRVLPHLPVDRCHALATVADAVLDSWPIGGMSSSYTAIHAGIPTVTRPSDVPFGRWLAAMYECIGVTDLIAVAETDYISLALRMAKDQHWRRDVSARIKSRNGIFIEDRLAVRELESFFSAAAAAAHRGERPRAWKNGHFVGT